MSEDITQGGLPLSQAIQKYKFNNYLNLSEKYDEEKKYRQFHLNCQKNFQRGPITNPFSGIEKVSVLDEEQCEEIIRHIEDEDVYDPRYRIKVMQQIADSIDDRIVSYFGSEYSPIWMRFYANRPGMDWRDKYSFYWHCDGGPTKHLKLLLYLNSSEDSGGNTEFVDYMTTLEFKRIGYVCCTLDLRFSELQNLSDRYGIPWEPQKFDIKAGEGILFEPFNIMHKGVWPDKGTRYLVQVCFTAGHVHWYNMASKFKLLSNENSWPIIS